MKINTKKDVLELGIKFWIEKPPIQLWDNFDGNCILECLDTDAELGLLKVAFVDTVNGTRSTAWIGENELHTLLWDNRKFINQSGQLNDL